MTNEDYPSDIKFPDATTRRIPLALAVLLTVLVFLAAAVVSGYFVAWVTVPPHREFVPGTGRLEAPAGEGSGLDLPLGGGGR